MNKIHAIAIILILSSHVSIGQIILKKKDLQVQIDIISKEIDNENYEKAMAIFYSPSEILRKDNVSKKMLDQFNKIEYTLGEKKEEFDKIKFEVEKYKKMYESKEYCNSIKLLSMDLSNKNSYTESQKIKTQLFPKLLEAKQNCQSNREMLLEWELKFNSNEYEQIFYIFGINDSVKNYYFPSDRERYEKLLHQLQPKFDTYNSVLEKVVISPEKTIDSIYNKLNYEESEKLINYLKDIITKSKSEIQKLEGNNPVLTKKYNETKSKVEITLENLKAYREKNKPFSKIELEQYLKDNSIKIPVEKIFNYFKEIDRNLLPHDLWSNQSKFYNLYNLDVFGYYKLNEKYDSDLKRQVFKKTDEYNQLLDSLKKFKSEYLEKFYFHRGYSSAGNESFVSKKSKNFDINYDIDLKGFVLTIGDVLPYHCLNSFMPKVIDNLEFSSLPTNKVYDLWQSKNSYRETLLIQTSEETALEIESNREKIDVLFLFQIKGIEKRYLNDIDFQRDNHSKDGCKKPVEVVATKNLRIMIFNKMNNKIYYDKTF
jgi:hypothetical protein